MSKNPKDNELVKKGAVKKLLEDEYMYYIKLCKFDMFDAIDNLPAEPQGKDCVEREEALCQIENLTSIEHGGVSFFSRVQIRNVIAKLSPVLPASGQALRATPSGQARPDEEIERAIKRLRSWGQGEQGEQSVSIYTGRQVAVILEYALGLRLGKTVPGVIRKLFIKPDDELLGKEEKRHDYEIGGWEKAEKVD